jgi:hypothetical protein
VLGPIRDAQSGHLPACRGRFTRHNRRTSCHPQTLPAAGPQATIVAGRWCGITLCRIGSPVPLANLADQIIGWVSVYRELAGRLHTRADLCWGLFDEPAAIEIGPASESDLSNTSTLTPTLAVRS